MKVYFIPGLGASSNCFKFLELPKGFEKVYIDWYKPQGKETLEEYTRNMAKNIDRSEPFALVGYSFGGVIVQEMNKFLNPDKTILIASMRNNRQIPSYFKIVQKIRLTRWFPMSFFTNKGLLSYALARGIYFRAASIKLKEEIKMEEYMSQVNPAYMKWSIDAITRWKSTIQCQNLYQIHGTQDPIFPFKRILKSYREESKKDKYLYPIEKANHILVLQKPKAVNKALENILLNK